MRDSRKISQYLLVSFLIDIYTFVFKTLTMSILFYCFLLLNAIAFLLIGYDKQLAIKQKRRISEKTLLTFVGIGGTLGSGFGMLAFRHKTAKTSYLWKFWGIVILQIGVLYLLFTNGLLIF